jgi:hypothetical protein
MRLEEESVIELSIKRFRSRFLHVFPKGTNDNVYFPMILHAFWKKGSGTIFISKHVKFPDFTECDLKFPKTNRLDKHKVVYSNIGVPTCYIGVNAKSDCELKLWVEYTHIEAKEFVFSKENNILEAVLHKIVKKEELEEVERKPSHLTRRPDGPHQILLPWRARQVPQPHQ